MAASSTTQHRPLVQLNPAVLEVEQEPVDGASVGEAFVGQADGGDPGRGGAEDLVAVQLERLPRHPKRPRLARPSPADHHRHAGAAPGQVADHCRLVLPDRPVAVEDLADRLRAHHGAALVSAVHSTVHELPFEGQQLGRRIALNTEPAIMGDPHRPLLQEPVGGLVGLGERFLSARGDG
jgi:hypothetical protein